MAWPVYSIVPVEEMRAAGPSPVPVPQPPFLFDVKCWMPFPVRKVSDHASVDRKAGQFAGTATGGGPTMIGLN